VLVRGPNLSPLSQHPHRRRIPCLKATARQQGLDHHSAIAGIRTPTRSLACLPLVYSMHATRPFPRVEAWGLRALFSCNDGDVIAALSLHGKFGFGDTPSANDAGTERQVERKSARLLGLEN